jgi:peptidoglycan/xylan/chitin deacetylase (PgdA/CDA1 family)
MRISTSDRAFRVTVGFCLAALFVGATPARADVINRLPTSEKVVALTFDACETITPTTLDTKIRDTLVSGGIPFTIFVSGRFARHNRAALAELAKLEFENHSLNHDNHMEHLDDAAVRREVVDNDALLASITGRHTHYFRFPAGNFSPRTLNTVEGLGYKVVHWTFASGDPVKSLSPDMLTRWVVSRTTPGSILIFHINGRGWSTGAALPGIIGELQRRGYRFTRLDSLLE